jgi:ketosteroid isomerase-like protein
MELADAARFAEQWAADWDSHDIDRIMRHYSDDVVFVSPAAERIVGTASVHGKAALHSYWTKGLDKIPDLHFELRGVQFGVDTVVITYLNQRGQTVSEVLTFDADVVVFGRAAYGPPADR